MRIQGKQQIQTIPGVETRPTASRVREAVFNIWRLEILDCRWLDICAGTGSMGAEALCHGASVVVGIEHNRRACAVIQQNWRKLAQSHQTFQVLAVEVLRGLSGLREQQFDRIYFDPPYASDLYTPVMEAIATHHLLAPTGALAVEHGKKRKISAEVGHLQAFQTRFYGQTAITFYQGQDSSPIE